MASCAMLHRPSLTWINHFGRCSTGVGSAAPVRTKNPALLPVITQRASSGLRAVLNPGADPADENFQEPWLDLFPKLEELRWQMIQEIEAEADTKFSWVEGELHPTPDESYCPMTASPGRQAPYNSINDSHSSQDLGVENSGTHASEQN